MAERGDALERPAVGLVAAHRIRVFGTLTMIGGALLVVGATLTDLGSYAGLGTIGSMGNALSAAAGLGLIFLPFGLRTSRLGGTGTLANMGTIALSVGICLASLADVPAVLDPTDLEAGGALGPVGLVLLSVGFLSWFAAIQRFRALAGWRKYIFLVAGLWFPLTFPTVQLPVFVIPTGRPSFVLLAGMLGALQIAMGMILRERAAIKDGPLRKGPRSTRKDAISGRSDEP